MTRLDVSKTYKLYIGGQFPRSESGRSFKALDGDGRVLGHMCRGSRKDVRDAVVAAQKAAPGWASRTAYNRGQILYRMGEMLEGKRAEFIAALVEGATGEDSPARLRRAAVAQLDASIDRLVSFAGWADKYAQVLGCNNPVAGPFYNFSVPEPTGVVAVVAPDSPSLLGLVSLIAPVLCAGNCVVVLGSETHPIPVSLFGEVCATSDVPGGVVNLLTGYRAELLEHLAGHRDIDAVHAADLNDDEATTLRLGSADNVKRVTVRSIGYDGWFDEGECASPWWIEPFVETKTIWHPSAT